MGSHATIAERKLFVHHGELRKSQRKIAKYLLLIDLLFHQTEKFEF